MGVVIKRWREKMREREGNDFYMDDFCVSGLSTW